mmetsp:Transcript_41002/g.76232  ORF Transcript_41002/g.76232 Transcript_41002/m.76232 type:complete len:257 (-) Transcript_41002:280-1050(-)
MSVMPGPIRPAQQRKMPQIAFTPLFRASWMPRKQEMLNTGPGIISAKEIPARKIVGEIQAGVRKVISMGRTTGPPPQTNMPAVRKGMTHPWSKVSRQSVKLATARYSRKMATARATGIPDFPVSCACFTSASFEAGKMIVVSPPRKMRVGFSQAGAGCTRRQMAPVKKQMPPRIVTLPASMTCFLIRPEMATKTNATPTALQAIATAFAGEAGSSICLDSVCDTKPSAVSKNAPGITKAKPASRPPITPPCVMPIA